MRTQQAAIAARYRRCATQETAGVSPLYAALAINGRPVALTERNGEWLRWLAD